LFPGTGHLTNCGSSSRTCDYVKIWPAPAPASSGVAIGTSHSLDLHIDAHCGHRPAPGGHGQARRKRTPTYGRGRGYHPPKGEPSRPDGELPDPANKRRRNGDYDRRQYSTNRTSCGQALSHSRRANPARSRPAKTAEASADKPRAHRGFSTVAIYCASTGPISGVRTGLATPKKTTMVWAPNCVECASRGSLLKPVSVS